MNISIFLLIGLILSLILAWRAKFFVQVLLLAYWLVILLWSLQLVDFFSFRPITWSYQLQIFFTWQIDGLARLFALLISGIGVLIFSYAVVYTEGKTKKRAKLLALLQVFAVSMLGIVLTDNMLVLFLAWELTTVTSYLLIQFDIIDKKANQAAFNSLFISVLGGLAMLAGFIVLYQHTNTWSIQASVDQLYDSLSIVSVFWLLLLGAITKSAQFPFHFWLPGAMKAPTPVSAYLHSATMVNAGIYLLARFHPAFSSLSVWYPVLAFFGITTMVIAGVMSLFQRDLKAILAYTTLFALGSMVYLLASDQWLAAEAFAMFLLFHGLYKATAFMWVGTIDQSYGTRDIHALRGLGRRWPIASIVAVISLSAMAGLPPFYGFVVKEMLYNAKLSAGVISYGLMALAMISSMLIAAASLKCLYYWFIGDLTVARKKTLHWGFCSALILSMLILVLELFEPYLGPLLTEAANSITWQTMGFQSAHSGVSHLLSLATVAGGVVLFAISQWLNNRCHIHWPKCLNIQSCFEESLAKFLYFGRWFTYITQRQSLNKHLIIILSAFITWLLVAFFYLSNAKFPMIQWPLITWPVSVLSVLLIMTGISVMICQRFLINIISLAVLGLLMSAIFVCQGAPDVAMTQLLIEILTVIILVIALRKANFQRSVLTPLQKISHITIALVIGFAVTLLLFMVTSTTFDAYLSEYFITNSLPLAYGRNVVNVILVDFRAFDTFGEALVILATALAIWLLMDNHISGGRDAQGKYVISVLLQTATHFLVQIMLLLSVLLVLRGHNYPGGGFIGALVATAAIALYTLAFGVNAERFGFWSPRIIALGLLCFLLSMIWPLWFGQQILTGLWLKLSLWDDAVKLGTPLIFDFGIYFLIIGSLSWLIVKMEDKPI